MSLLVFPMILLIGLDTFIINVQALNIQLCIHAYVNQFLVFYLMNRPQTFLWKFINKKVNLLIIHCSSNKYSVNLSHTWWSEISLEYSRTSLFQSESRLERDMSVTHAKPHVVMAQQESINYENGLLAVFLKKNLHCKHFSY